MGAKTPRLEVRNYSNFTKTFPMIWRCAGDFFKVLLKFKMAATNQFEFFGGAKTQKNCLVNFFSQFNITFQATCMTWGCASDFLKMLPKFKMAARGQLQFFLSAQKLKVRNYSNITITLPMICRCAGNFFKVLLKFKMAVLDKLHIFLWAQKLKN